MFFKSIEMTGFKSFPDKINLNFEKGITCVVGPNGSGKSNISDAIRWVMGEQSIKTLRGGKMEDVIFSGTEKRKPLGFSEVNLLVDNKDRGLHIDYDEVLITRRLFRSGESEYYINKSSCRLKDIQELFMDTGLGKDGYSLVGQGKIDNIISGKPSDRRIFFEEACGISKYHHKKDESERKLENTENNILRINDIVAELETQLAPLKNQSEKAKKFLVLRDELRVLEVNVWLSNYHTYNEELLKISENYENSKKQVEDTKLILEKLDLSIEELTKKSKDLQEENDRLTQENYNSEYNIKTFENQIEISKNDIEHINENIKRLNNEKAEIKKKLDEFLKNEELFSQNISKINEDKNNLENELTNLVNELNNILSDITSHNSGVDKLRLSLAEKNNEFLSIKAKKSAVTSLMESLNERIEKLKDVLNEKSKRKEETEKTSDNLKKELDEIINKEKELRENKEEISKKYSLQNEEKEKLQIKITDISNEIHKTKNRLDILKDMENSFSAMPKGVKELLKNGPKNVNLHGTVSSLIKTENKYATAIDSALGASANHIVCENEEDAKKSIEFLKSNKLGRVTFMPLTSVKGQGKLNVDLKNEDGYIGIASELLTYDKKYENIILNILNRVAVFSDIDNCIKAEKKYKHTFKAVTLTGEIFNVGGSITGGEYKNNVGAMQRNSEIDSLEKKLKEKEEELKTVNDEFSKVNSILLKIEEELKEKEEKLKSFNTEKIEIMSELKYENEMILNIENDLQSEKNEIDEINKKIRDSELSITSYNNEISRCQTEIDAISDKITSSDSGFSIVLKKKDDINEKINEYKLKIAEKEKDISYENDKIEAIAKERENFLMSMDAKEEEIEEAKDRILDINDEIEFRKNQIEETREQLSDYLKKIEENKQSKIKCEEDLDKNREDSKDLREKFVALSEDNTRLEVKVSKIENDIEQTVNNLWESYELTLTDAEKIKSDIGSISGATRKISDLRGKIKELGNINIDAIEEYEAVNERYTFLTNQRDDLTKAKKDLEKIITDMIKLMKEIFKEQFNLIAESFDKTYTELFGGGKGTIRLTDPDNILESGIEIEVQPPGKKLTTISLLSGGEKAFTAIALLFAIIKVKPTPFCMFDEIEAALDDNNVYRYADYLDKFKKNTQFVIITHRRGTMEAADTLYGVTMQEKGVSKLLSINIDEIEREGLNK